MKPEPVQHDAMQALSARSAVPRREAPRTARLVRCRRVEAGSAQAAKGIRRARCVAAACHSCHLRGGRNRPARQTQRAPSVGDQQQRIHRRWVKCLRQGLHRFRPGWLPERIRIRNEDRVVSQNGRALARAPPVSSTSPRSSEIDDLNVGAVFQMRLHLVCQVVDIDDRALHARSDQRIQHPVDESLSAHFYQRLRASHPSGAAYACRDRRQAPSRYGELARSFRSPQKQMGSSACTKASCP
jgi:hypothetical protein